MAVAVIQDWIEEETDRRTTNYDAITEKLMAQGPVDGLRVHTAGFTGNGFRIVDVWDSKEQFDRFTADRLMPLVMEQDGDPTPPTLTVYELHNLVVP